MSGSVFDPAFQHGDVDKKIVAALERLSQVFRRLLQEKAQERDLSPIQARFLIHLLHHDVALRRVSQLAREFGLTQATVSDAVASLEAKGLLDRERWPDDRRIITLRLTREGERVATELSSWANPLAEHMRGFPAEEKEAVIRFLMGLITSLQRSGVISVARMCVTCKFFRPDVHPGSEAPHHCALLDTPLAGSDLRIDCPEHELVKS